MAQKMSCEDVMSKLYAYLDNEIDAPTEAYIDEHIHHCRDCFSRAEFEKALRKRVASTAEVVTPSDTRSRLESLIKRF